MLKQLSLSCKIYHCFSPARQLLVCDSLIKSSQQPIGTHAKQIKHFVWKRKSPNFCKQKINCNFIFISFCISIWFGNDSHIRLKVLRKIKASLFFYFWLRTCQMGQHYHIKQFLKTIRGHLKTTLNWRVSYDLASHFQCLISPLISDQSCKWEFSARVIIICQHHFIQSIPRAVAIPNTFVLPIIKPPPQWNRLRDDDEIPLNHQLQSLPFSPQT